MTYLLCVSDDFPVGDNEDVVGGISFDDGGVAGVSGVSPGDFTGVAAVFDVRGRLPDVWKTSYKIYKLYGSNNTPHATTCKSQNSVLQCNAMQCNAMQCNATQRNAMQYTT